MVARHLQQRAAKLQTAAERRQQTELDRMLQNPADTSTLVELTDQAFRSSTPRRAVDHLLHLLDLQGVPRFFGTLDRALLQGFRSFGGYLPGVALPLVKEHLQKETANVILPGEPALLRAHLRARAAEGVRMNVNFLGEAILGEAEAARRLQQYLEALRWPEIEVVSVKISTLCSQISALAREHVLDCFGQRLELLFREAAHLEFQRPDGSSVPKFVYLDMESYEELHLTVDAFIRTLDRPGLERVRAGLALQAYIPESFDAQQRLLAWARQRVARGGASVTLRIVKGANLEMERVDASIRGWPQAPFKTKGETDANFKRMIEEGLRPENLNAVHLGVASHNLFEIAYAWVLADERNALNRVQFEMLEGMANPQRRALRELTGSLLLYAPACRKELFLNAIAYLVRRLDENTGPDNFLRHAFRIRVGSADWNRLEQAFLDSIAARDRVSHAPRRTQDRWSDVPPLAPAVARGWQQFVNEPDTDFALPHHVEWGQHIVDAWLPRHGERAAQIPVVVAGEEWFDDREVRACLDPSRPGLIVARCRQATENDANHAVTCAREDADGWRRLSSRDRFERLGRVAQTLRKARADLMGAAMANGGKTLAESDPEVSEAVDFVEFYRDTARWYQELPGISARPRGVVLVVPPWNFPIAIPCGGVAAALAAGNTVILKPASDAALVSWELCRCFWDAGVPRSALQFLPCGGATTGRHLANHSGVDAVILTGGTATAMSMLRDRPDLNLAAETGGKNATIVTALADRDQAIKHAVHSAFSHSGQKCSATSLLLLEAEVYDDPGFRGALCDAVESLPVGSAWDLKTRVGPLIRPPSGDLERALQLLEPGEEWAVRPRQSDHNPNLWTPGVKYGVQSGTTTHLTEFFGPLLGVMRFESLAEAIALVNQTGYGLTSGLESLDEREQDEWQEQVQAGNLYINRVTTGAVVLRQPFGGIGKSAFGPGIKAGGPNYVAQFMEFEETAPVSSPDLQADHPFAGFLDVLKANVASLGANGPAELSRLRAAVHSYERALQNEFGCEHDHFWLLGQDNIRRYRKVVDVRIRLHPDDSSFDVLARIVAARTVGCRITVSVPEGMTSPVIGLLEDAAASWTDDFEITEESDNALAELIRSNRAGRLRYGNPGRVPDLIRMAAAEIGLWIAAQPVLREGRLELLWYVQEQSLSRDYHRYGNLGRRKGESRADTL